MDRSRPDGLIPPPPPIGEAPELVVALGASAGGLVALEQFFEPIGPPTGMAFVIIQHLSPHFKSLMDELLGRHSRLTVRRAEHGVHLRADHAYLMPPGVEMILSGDQLLLTEKDPTAKLTFPIDHFFRSLAREYGHRAVAIVLSGTGSDGSRGIVDVQAAGGLVLVQDEESAKFSGMPSSALHAGVDARTVRPGQMYRLLAEHLQQQRGSVSAVDRQLDDQPPRSELQQVFDLLREEFHIDFGLYRPTTIGRRTERRLALKRLPNLAKYLELLRADPAERQALYHDLLIGVTSFMRDKPAFEHLEQQTIPELVQQLSDGDTLRAWVVGCASGEEAYSLAILIDQVVGRLEKRIDVKIFATDVHQPSLDIASQGLYSAESLTGLPPPLLERYFIQRGNRYQIIPRIREMLIFATHNILNDSPFTRLHLISCRNLLIYFQGNAQKKVLGLFHFALKTSGVLFLGGSESLGDFADEFEPLEEHWRIFRKRRDIRIHAPLDTSGLLGTGPARELSAGPTHERSGGELTGIYESLLTHLLSCSIVIDDRRQILHLFGDASRFIGFRQGRPSLDLLAMVDSNLKMLLAGAIQRAERKRTSVRLSNLRSAGDGTGPGRAFDLLVQPFEPPGGGRTLFHIAFSHVETDAPLGSSPSAGEEISAIEASRDRVEALERNLRDLQENLQITIEELETSNEELEASNEELLAANEELQSTNEELHSVNEELYTVNTELQKKIEQLKILKRDDENLFHSTQVHTLFLDESLCIRRFTPHAGRVFNIIASDQGRKIDTFVHTIRCDDFGAKLRRALEDDEAFEEEVQDLAGTHYLMRIYPYQSDRPKAGLVVTLVDITALKQAEQQFRVAVETAPGALIMVDPKGLIRLANQRSEVMFGYRSQELVGQPIEMLMPPRLRERHRHHRHTYSQTPTIRSMGRGMHLIGMRKGGQEFPIDVQLSPISTPEGQFTLAAVVDHSETKRLERSLRNQVVNRDNFLAMLSHELRNPLGAVLNAATILERLAEAHEQYQGFVAIILRQARQMSHLLEDLLDVSRVSQGKISLNYEQFDLREAIRESVEASRHLTEQRRQQLTVELPAEDCRMVGDRSRILQVLENLLTNANKYTPKEGAIHVRLGLDANEVRLEVRDTGRGIGADKLESIFDMFTQVDSSIDRQESGMGVGLTLVRSIVRLHGGSVSAHSEGPGQGSLFAVRLPRGDWQHEPAPSGSPGAAPQNLQLVLVEDNDESRMTLKMLLEMEGFQVTTASDGQRGLELIVELQPRAAILDIGLPGLDGYQVAQAVRERFESDQIYLIALTGYGRTEDRHAVRQAGFDEHLVKPVQLEGLLAALAQITSG
jgi:two-component system, chemotaxis family, CheB/CheR fusion protein